MNKINSVVLFLFVVASIFASAQKREIEFRNKKTNLRNVFELPHPCLIQLKKDSDGYFNRAILDSVNNDTFYISSINKPFKSLSVASNKIKFIKLPERDFVALPKTIAIIISLLQLIS